MKLEQLTAPSLRDLFVKTIQDAIISGNTDLSTLPLYKELAVLRHLCALDQPQSPGYQDPRS